ncbi:MarR family transcriptional regulator [Nonomuraea candida]|uniref:MarR family transcriptional regulator n=1 Tax=Nonomuraea candida TaxID=359159 RepID=UPI0005BD47FC
MVRTGLSRMTARVLACLYATDSGSLTAAELVRRVQASPASISKAIGRRRVLATRRAADREGRSEAAAGSSRPAATGP